MLFAHGKRPDRDAIRAFAARCPAVSISHDPIRADAPQAEVLSPKDQHWLEMVRDGLTFDLTGLAPGPESPLPELRQRFDLPGLPDLGDHEAMTLRPGPHIAAAAKSMPVIRTMMALACDLVRQFDDLLAVGWEPAGSVMGRRFFESVTTAWLDSGPFPALGLTAFVEAPDGALHSVGLAFWIDRELRIEPPLSADRVAATRLAIRLVNHLILMGGLEADDRITAPDGSRLVLRPSRERALISVWRE
ncbi:hypothetical protein GVM20_05585 [Porphyrobacter sp. SLTP]|nr:hypothetical protein [Porphyrobacter sp. SLTP]